VPHRPPGASPTLEDIQERRLVSVVGVAIGEARRDGTQTAVATGRTPGSLAVICGDRDGQRHVAPARGIVANCPSIMPGFNQHY